ncbi:uncharacterized protein [Haliotis asinina]|uniref:uncharacterized protein isoform X2 n=1 Tax=Haliotis asinina TaxID=109174 RepID=UPI0035326E13
MANERTPEEQAYFDLLAKYKEEDEEEEKAAEAQFEKDLERALALSLSEEAVHILTQSGDIGPVTDGPNEDLVQHQLGRQTHSRRNRRFVTSSSPDADAMGSVGGNSINGHHPSGRPRSVELAEQMRKQVMEAAGSSAQNPLSGQGRSVEKAEEMGRRLSDEGQSSDGEQFHPSGRRRSIEMAKEMQRQMLTQGSDDEGFHPSGRRRSVELAKKMQNEMLAQGNNDEQFHPSGRRRSVELAKKMQNEMLAQGNNDEQFHPSGRRRSVELAEEMRKQVLEESQNGENSNEYNMPMRKRSLRPVETVNMGEDDEVSREIEELILRGIIKPDHRAVRTSSRSSTKSDSDSELFGDGSTHMYSATEGPSDHQVQRQGIQVSSSSRMPQNHRIDFKNPFGFADDEFPLNWDRSRIPDVQAGELFQLVQILPGEDEYETIARDFHIADLEVKKIERLQNVHLLDRYKGEKELLMRRRGRDFEVNTRYLYHGSAANKMLLCEEGLDARLGMSGCFGKGIYFSDNPKKCVQYVSRSSVKYILMCRVMLGEAKIYPRGEMDRDLKREPEKETPTGRWRFYDSVRGRPVDFNEYVIYENRRAMIEYIITFQGQGSPADHSELEEVGGAVAANIIPPMLPEESVEDHMKRIAQVREEIRIKRAEERGEVYTGPTEAQRKKDRDVWRRVLRVTCPPGSEGYENAKGIFQYLKKEEEEEEKAKAEAVGDGGSHSAINTNNNNNDSDLDIATARSLAVDAEDNSVEMVMSCLISDFLEVTKIDNVQKARMYLEKSGMNLDQALLLYYEQEL